MTILGCATANPYKQYYEKNDALLQSGEITPEEHKKNTRLIATSEVQWLQQENMKQAAIWSAISSAAGQAAQAPQPQAQTTQFIQPSGGTYRVQHVGGSTYRVDDMAPTVIPAPRNE